MRLRRLARKTAVMIVASTVIGGLSVFFSVGIAEAMGKCPPGHACTYEAFPKGYALLQQLPCSPPNRYHAIEPIDLVINGCHVQVEITTAHGNVCISPNSGRNGYIADAEWIYITTKTGNCP